jgi:hypothetical protein
MVWIANADQIQFPPHAFGIAVDEFGGQGLRRLEEPDQWPGQSRYPIHAHKPMITSNWLAYQYPVAAYWPVNEH